MNPHSVGIYYFGTTAHSGKVKPAFAFLDKVFHPATTTIKLNDLIGIHIHICHDKGILVYKLAVWFLDFENHTSWIFLCTGLIHEFTISCFIANLVLFGCFVQNLHLYPKQGQ